MSQQFVENVLEVHTKYKQLIKDVFQGDQVFVGALDKACTAVINHKQAKGQPKPPELVSQNRTASDCIAIGQKQCMCT